MMKRGLLALFAAGGLAAPLMMAPALVTPVAAQASLNIGLSVPGPAMPAPMFGTTPAPDYATAIRGTGRIANGNGIAGTSGSATTTDANCNAVMRTQGADVALLFVFAADSKLTSARLNWGGRSAQIP
jgi:hypothetical protein